MRKYLGRGIGVIAGFPAGPAGIFFGFLIGALIDQYGSSTDSVRRLRRYISRPGAEQNDRRALSLATAILVGMILPRPTEEAISFVAGIPWPQDDLDRTAGKSPRNRRRYVHGAVSMMAGRPPEYVVPVLEDVKRRFGNAGTGETDCLVEFLVMVESTVDTGKAPAPEEVIRYIGASLGIGEPRLVEMERRYRGLDSNACRIMGVSPMVNREELKRVYRRLVSNLHPDTSSVLDEYQRKELEEAFLRIRSAYDLLLLQLDERTGFRG